MVTKEELRAIIKEVVRELQEERRDALRGRLEKARKAKEERRAAEAVGGKSVVLSRQTKTAFELLSIIEPASQIEWRDQLVRLAKLTPEAARKVVARAIPPLLEAGLIEELMGGRFKSTNQQEVLSRSKPSKAEAMAQRV